MKRLFQAVGVLALLAVIYADVVLLFCIGR
jgi:hypothetical protein